MLVGSSVTHRVTGSAPSSAVSACERPRVAATCFVEVHAPRSPLVIRCESRNESIWRWVLVALSMLFVLGQPVVPQVWSCSMSGARTRPCPCGEGGDDLRSDCPHAERQPCCERQSRKHPAMATRISPMHTTPVRLSTRQPGFGHAALLRGIPPLHDGRGPPQTGPPAFLAQCSLLL